MRVWSPDPSWTGRDAYLIGGGASLLGFPFGLLNGRCVIGCNEAFRLGVGVCPIAHFSDATWWHRAKWDLEKYQESGGTVLCSSPSLKHIRQGGFYYVHREKSGVLTNGAVGWNYSTGASAINLALQFGASRVFLLGYDLSQTGARTHWHNRYPKQTKEACFHRFLRGFSCVAAQYQGAFPGTQVVNVVGPAGSRLEGFSTMSLAEMVAALKQ